MAYEQPGSGRGSQKWNDRRAKRGRPTFSTQPPPPSSKGGPTDPGGGPSRWGGQGFQGRGDLDPQNTFNRMYSRFQGRGADMSDPGVQERFGNRWRNRTGGNVDEMMKQAAAGGKGGGVGGKGGNPIQPGGGPQGGAASLSGSPPRSGRGMGGRRPSYDDHLRGQVF